MSEANEKLKLIPTNGTYFDRGPSSPVTIKLSPEQVHDFYAGFRGTANDLRKKGGSVSVHNDYQKDGKSWTFWQMTFPLGPSRLGKPHLIALIGEGETDVEALDKIRAQYAELTDHLHHAPMCPANHYHGMRAPTAVCSCGAAQFEVRS